MPFDLSVGPHIAKKLGRFWNYWPIEPSARFSGSDVVSNLALYIPLGWLIVVRQRMKARGCLYSLLIACGGSFVLSGGIEMVQLASEFRTASGADWLFNTISGLIGGSAGVLYGVPIWVGGVAWLRSAWDDRPKDVATLALIGLMAADALSPYIPTILLKQVWRSLKRSHFDLAAGLAEHPWHWWLVTRVLLYGVLTMLLAGWGGRRGTARNWLQALILAGGLALCLELVKPMIVSRSINVANVVTSWIGCLMAVAAGAFLVGRVGDRKKLTIAVSGLLGYICYLWWTPFNLAFDGDMVMRALPSPIRLLPLYDYAMGAKLEHARLFVQGIFLSCLLTYLLRIRFDWFEGAGRFIGAAAFSLGGLGVLLEAGQLFLPGRTPSPTDVYCFAAGGSLGAWLPRPGKRQPMKAATQSDYSAFVPEASGSRT